MKVVLYGGPVISFGESLRKRLTPGFELATVDYDATDHELAAALAEAQALVAVRYDGRLPSVPTLRLVQVPGVGCDEIDASVLPANVTLCNVHGHGDAVAEFAILGMLQWCHRFFEADASFRAGSWERSSRLQASPHRELSGSVVGIIGYGLIGRGIAEHLRGFNVTTLVCNRSKPASDALHSRHYPLSDIGAMAAECDFLVVSIPLTEATTNLVDKEVLAAMKPEAVLVNVARGQVINEAAFFDALRSNDIGGAIIDVWYNYPSSAEDHLAKPSNYDFTSLPNVYMTPHISGWTEGTVERRWNTIAENLTRLSKGQPLLNIVQRTGT